MQFMTDSNDKGPGITARRMKQARERLGLSQADLATLLNKKQQQIGEWEANDIDMRLSQLQAIADALSVPLDYLAGRSSDDGDTDEEREMAPAKRKLLWYIDRGMELEAIQQAIAAVRDEQGRKDARKK